MFIITDKCSRYGHPEFVVSCEDIIPESDVKHFVSYLEESVANGEVFKKDEILLTGWMTNTFLEMDDGLLALLEPDMKLFPINWEAGVTQTLRHMRLHKDIVESVLPLTCLEIPDIRQSVIVGDDVGAGTRDFYLERKDHGNRSTGWFIGNMNSQIDYDDPENVHVVAIYAVAIEIPHLIMFFGLPVGTRVERSPGRITIFHNGSKLEPKPDSFLESFLDGLSLREEPNEENA